MAIESWVADWNPCQRQISWPRWRPLRYQREAKAAINEHRNRVQRVKLESLLRPDPGLSKIIVDE